MGASSGSAADYDPTYRWPRLVLAPGESVLFCALPPRCARHGYAGLTREDLALCAEVDKLVTRLNYHTPDREEALRIGKASRYYAGLLRPKAARDYDAPDMRGEAGEPYQAVPNSYWPY